MPFPYYQVHRGREDNRIREAMARAEQERVRQAIAREEQERNEQAAIERKTCR